MLKAVITAKGPLFEGKAPEIIQRSLDSAMTEAVLYLEALVKKYTPVGVFGAQGGLLSTEKGEVIGRGTPVMKGVVAHQSVYGDVRDLGRTAGKAMPPKGSLVRWIEVKMGLDAKTAARIEFVVRRKIGQKGYPGAFMFERAFTEGWPNLISIFDRSGFNIARELNA